MPQKIAIKWLSYVKITTRHNCPKSLSTSLQVGALLFYVSHNLLGDPKFVKDLFEFHNYGNAICNNCLKQPNRDVLGLPSSGHKINNYCKNIMSPFGHSQIKSVSGYQAFCQGKLHKFGQCHVHQCGKNLFDENLSR